MHGDVIIMVMSLSRNGGTGLGKSYCGNDTDVIFLYLIFVSVWREHFDLEYPK